MKTITGLDELKASAGEVLGTSDWHAVTQDAIDAFADVTGDHQWIHVDPERTKDTPFGGTIAHGYYTLSLAPMLTGQVMSLEGFAFAVNSGGAQMTLELAFEVEGGEKPACVAETVARVYTAS